MFSARTKHESAKVYVTLSREVTVQLSPMKIYQDNENLI